MKTIEQILGRCEIGDCWRWQGARNTQGYGTVWISKSMRVHRVVWEMLVGVIPDGMVIDHLCSVKNCVNPDHLRVATYKQNSDTQARRAYHRRSRRKMCGRGLHEMSGDNVYVGSAGRKCRACRDAYNYTYYRKARLR